MAKRITEFTSATVLAETDVLPVVDLSDTTQATSGTTKKLALSLIADYLKARVETLTNKTINVSDNTLSGMLDWFYPIGTIYETTSTDLDTTTKMANHFGGTWEAFGQGRVMVGKDTSGTFATAGATGGAETHTLTASQSGLRSHRHQLRLGSPLGDGSYNDKVGRVAETTSSEDGFRTGLAYSPTSSNGSEGFGSASLDNASATEAHNNLQPYIVVYRYRRTA